MRVLVVEDHPDVRSVIADSLLLCGHQVVEADTVDAAVAVLGNAGCCDAVISEVHLKDGTGLDVADAARRRGVPTLLCTWDPLLAVTLEHAHVAHLCKPFHLAALEEWVGNSVKLGDAGVVQRRLSLATRAAIEAQVKSPAAG